MIAALTGTVSDKYPDYVVLEVSGVGYGLFVTNEDFGSLSMGRQTKLHVYEHIRENSYDLFGFVNIETKKLFEKLIEVNGVGPKMAINVLSIGSVDSVRQAIASGDTRYIQAASGVGKRVAERIIVDLKDKVGLGIDSSEAGITIDGLTKTDEAVEALISLGFSAQAAVNALHNIDPGLTIEERVKQALKHKA